MNRFNRGMLLTGILLILLFAGFLANDLHQFQIHQAEIMAACRLSDPIELQGASFALVMMRSLEFLVPAILLIFCALVMHYKEEAIPHQKGEFRRIFLKPFRFTRHVEHF